MEALASVFGYDKVGIRISPTGRYNDMFDSNPVAIFSYFLERLDEKGFAFVELRKLAMMKIEMMRKCLLVKNSCVML